MKRRQAKARVHSQLKGVQATMLHKWKPNVRRDKDHNNSATAPLPPLYQRPPCWPLRHRRHRLSSQDPLPLYPL